MCVSSPAALIIKPAPTSKRLLPSPIIGLILRQTYSFGECVQAFHCLKHGGLDKMFRAADVQIQKETLAAYRFDLRKGQKL